MTGTQPLAAYPRLAAADIALKEGELDKANALVLQHLREHRGEPRGLALLGSIALKGGALVQAEQFLRQALARGAASFDVQWELASAINQQERLGEALAAFDFLSDRIDDPQLRATKALILDKLGRNAEAIAEHRRLTERFPHRTHVWIGYGHSLRAAGRMDEAIASYRKAVGIDPEYGEGWWALANIKARVLADEDIEVIERALTSANDLLNIVPLHFALGRAWHDRKAADRAFEHFFKGNELRAESINYRPEELTAEVDDYVRRLGPAELAAGSLPKSPLKGGPIPVFLVSMPRAGSTLLEQMLDQHPDIEAVGELPYIRAILRSAMELRTRSGPAKVVELVTSLSARECEAFGADYMERANLHRKTEAPYFIDKMPMNWSDIPFIRRTLPQALFIDIRRPAMDCCFSNYIHYFSRAHSSSFRLDDIGRCYVDYVRLMDHVDNVAPGLVHHVSYERLIETPEAELRKVLSHLGLAWDQSILSFHESERVVRTPSAEQVRRPLNRQGFGVWRAYEAWLQPLREALGALADG